MVINKKVYLLFFIILIIMGVAGCSSRNADRIESGKDITMFVATDIHYLSKELAGFGREFEAFVASGDGKQLNYCEEIVDAFARDIKREKPDILIISGDLTNNGEKESHISLSNKLKNIEKSGTRVFVIPGNHDIQNPWARGFKGGIQYKTATIGKNEFSKIYKNFGYSEAISRDKSTLSYLVAPSEDIWLLMLDTSQYEYNKLFGRPTTNGKIKPETFEWIKQSSELAQKSNAQIVTVTHHNLLNHNESLSEGFTLDNSKEALEIFKSSGLNLNLSGHIHIQDIKVNKEATNDIYDITTSSLSVYPEQYGILKFLPSSGFEYSTSKVDVEGWGKENDIKDKNVLNFKKYSRDFFANSSYIKAYEGLKQMDVYSEEERKLMAETMSLLNINYFGGTVDSVRSEVINSKGYKLWIDAKPGFLKEYVLSMVSDSYTNKNELRIPKINTKMKN